jgi:hypothetical protein
MPTPAAIASAVPHPVTSRSRPVRGSATSTVPASGACMPLSTRMSVLLPAPFSPTSACTSPRAASSDASRLATTGPNAFATPRTRTAAGRAPAAAWGPAAVIACSAPGCARR